MKRIPALMLILCLLMGLTACAGQAARSDSADKILVVYFSGTGNTKRVAEHIADILDADLYEIEPEVPYTEEDLNDTDSDSRPSQEYNDDTARPAISGSVEHIEDYGVVYLGYPIWWGEAPKIVYTFLESYDFSGKTIVPFCTSGNIDIGSSAVNMHDCTSGSTKWLDGVRFPSAAARQAVAEWLEELPSEVTNQ